MSVLTRQILLYAGALIVGLIGIPLLVWMLGQAILGPYAQGGLAAFMSNQFRHLSSGSIPHWIVALGPVLLLSILQSMRKLLLNR